jgi:transcriptional regulator with XRE-family HTH domain
MNDAQSISAAVGAFVSQARREQGLTLDQVARAARSYGASWSASSVSNIERGQAALTLPVLLLLALALGELMGRPLTLSNLLGDAKVLALVTDDRYSVERSWVDSALRGAEVSLKSQESVGALDAEVEYDVDEDFEEEVLHKMREMRGQKMTPNLVYDQVAQHLEQSQIPYEAEAEAPARMSVGDDSGSLAEERAAKKLGISTAQLQNRALDLWAHPLEEESYRRAGMDSTAQARGRVTRVLVDEIRESLEGRH